VAFSGQFLLVRMFHRGLAGSRGAARVLAGCDNAAAAARPRRSRPAICPSCPGSGRGVPGADHDHGHFRSYPDRKCPWSWTSTVRGCRLSSWHWVITGTPSHRYGYRGGGAARDRAADGTAEADAAGEAPGNRRPGRALIRRRSLQKAAPMCRCTGGNRC